IYDERPDHVLVFGADHIYRMDPRQMVKAHVESGAGVTVAAVRVPAVEAGSFGVISSDSAGRIRSFEEKPSGPVASGRGWVYASMGNYVFTTQSLIDAVTADASDAASNHDIGGNIIPALVTAGEACVYDFSTNEVPGSTDRDRGYWRDVGTLDAFYAAHMDLISVHPIFNLYNRAWPIYSWHDPSPPAKFVFDEDGRRGHALDSMVSAGVIISGGTVRRAILSPEVLIDSGALVERSILMHAVRVGGGAVVRRAILDKFVEVAPGARIGVDPQADRRRFTISESGIAVIARGQKVPAA
ncbi:MAG: sugar phosphate nucleotidyltransferase, partial [Actinomycetota bacterium]